MRASVDIVAVVGMPGSGKSLFTTRMAWMARRKNPDRRIVANYPIYLPGRPVEVVESIKDCFQLEDCLLVLDEMHSWLGSRDWKKHDNEYTAWVSQLRHVNIDLWYCTQAIEDVDPLLRRRTTVSYWLQSFRRIPWVGFFYWRAFFGVKPVKKAQYLRGWYFFNPVIASLYDTTYMVRI